ncbi:PAS domain S-box protein [Nostoc sp.]|uniref:PAS domain S-box protein n=1 Tax=Nostoc sp. TaxID=1180 RepID=UPI002FFB11BF
MESGKAELHIIEQWQWADGQQIWLDTSKMPLRDAKGNVFGILLVTKDITKRQMAQEELKQQKQNLEEALAELQLMLWKSQILDALLKREKLIPRILSQLLLKLVKISRK